MAQQNNGMPPATQPKIPAGPGPAMNGNGHHPQRNGYTKKAMEEIKSSLLGFEKSDRPPAGVLARPVSALSTGSSTYSATSSDYVQCMALAMNNGLIIEEVRPWNFLLATL